MKLRHLISFITALVGLYAPSTSMAGTKGYVVVGNIILSDYVIAYTENEHMFLIPQYYLATKKNLPEYVLLNDYRCFLLSERKPVDSEDESLSALEFKTKEKGISYLQSIQQMPVINGIDKIFIYTKKPDSFILYMIKPTLWNKNISRVGKHIWNIRPFTNLSDSYWMRVVYPLWE